MPTLLTPSVQNIIRSAKISGKGNAEYHCPVILHFTLFYHFLVHFPESMDMEQVKEGKNLWTQSTALFNGDAQGRV